MLINGGSRSEKENALLNLLREQDSDELMDNIYLYTKYLIKISVFNSQTRKYSTKTFK